MYKELKKKKYYGDKKLNEVLLQQIEIYKRAFHDKVTASLKAVRDQLQPWMEAKAKNEQLVQERNSQYENLVEDLKTKLNS